ncbi:biliverdin-producing heme oxygenase (plasmid) [Hymenobacter tibetensis]|uniref:Biliverdin-producing heme oxygenase n=1 Tax=Hymenobacter tibetensis TaxID=497967 RepID=A0ABY4D4U6_9BACT|nr:biliverdin-producing heme oxygenase [Hymenobacter tibetensis]UOG77539.1 biliverdin-producing heme oxygenase [Hymenobacter tibetensis]
MTTPLSTEILLRLRAETRPYHEALEQNRFNQALAAGLPTYELTSWFLRKMYGFLVPYEEQLRQHTWPPAWQIERRYRAHLILEDLPAATASGALPLCPAMPPLRTWPELLGALYVLEGSTLGGQVLARQLAKAGISTRTYFSGYGDQTGLMWKSFCHLLGEAATEINQDEIVLSARRTFQHLDAWLNHE